MNLARYFMRKIGWYLVVFIAALLINFILPRLIPGNPVDALVAQMTRGGGASGDAVKAVYENYMREFGLDQPLWKQFLTYVGNVLQGDLGTSFAQYPASVNTLIGQALPWSIALQLPVSSYISFRDRNRVYLFSCVFSSGGGTSTNARVSFPPPSDQA